MRVIAKIPAKKQKNKKLNVKEIAKTTSKIGKTAFKVSAKGALVCLDIINTSVKCGTKLAQKGSSYVSDKIPEFKKMIDNIDC